MQALEQNKGAIIGGLILLIGLFAYNAFFSSPPDVVPAQNSGADLVKLSEDISKATLSREIFSATSYKLLFDWSTPLTPEPTGRLDPFAPIGQ